MARSRPRHRRDRRRWQQSSGRQRGRLGRVPATNSKSKKTTPRKSTPRHHTHRRAWATRGVSTKARKQDNGRERQQTTWEAREGSRSDATTDAMWNAHARACRREYGGSNAGRWQRRQHDRLDAAGAATTFKKGRRNKTDERAGGRRLASLDATVKQRALGSWLTRRALRRHRHRRWRPQEHRGNSRGQPPYAATTDGTLGA